MRDLMARRWPLIILAIGALLLLVRVAAVLSGSEDEDRHDDEHADHGDEDGAIMLTLEQRDLVGIEVAECDQGKVQEVLETPALIHARADGQAVVAAASLAIVDRVHVDVGDWVSRGQPVAVLRSPTLAEAQGAVTASQAELRSAEAALRSERRLAELGETDGAALEESEREFVAADQGRRSAEELLSRTRALAQIEAFDMPELEAARERLGQSVAERRLAESTLERTRAQADAGSYTGPELEGAAVEVAEAEARLASASAKLRQAEAEADRVEAEVARGVGVDETAEDARVSLAEAVAAHGASRAEAGRAQRAVERAVALQAQGLAADQDVERVTAERDTAMTALAEAETALEVRQAQARRADDVRAGGLSSGRLRDTARAALAEARAEHASAEEARRQAQARARRTREVEGRGVPAQQALAEAEAALASALQTEEAARAEYDRQVAVAEQGLRTRQHEVAADAEYATSEKDREVAERRLERAQRVASERLRSSQRVLEAEAAMEQARARLAGARAAVSALSSGRALGSGRLEMVAPIDGTVTARRALPGQAVGEGEVLLEVTNIETVWVEALLYDTDVSLVQAGQDVYVSLEAYPGRTFHSQIASVDVMMDEHTRRAKARALLDNPDGALRPDMLATAGIAIARREVGARIPLAAIMYDHERPYAYVETEPGRFERRDLLLGLVGGDMAEVLKGVSPGESVVIKGAVMLKSEEQKEAFADDDHGH